MKITDQELADRLGKLNSQTEKLLMEARKRAVAAKSIDALKSIDSALCCTFNTHRALLDVAQLLEPRITPFSGGGK